MNKLFPLLFLFVMSCSSNEEKKENTENKSNSSPSKETTVEETIPEETTSTNETITNEDCIGELNVYLNDSDQSGTNIRNAPNGKVVYKLVRTDENFEYFITCSEAKDGWFKIHGEIASMESPVILEGENWIHGSVLGAATRNYGSESIPVYADANSATVVTQITSEVGLSFLDLCKDKVKVKWKDDKGNHEGWIDVKWVCGNPLTTCS